MQPAWAVTGDRLRRSQREARGHAAATRSAKTARGTRTRKGDPQNEEFTRLRKGDSRELGEKGEGTYGVCSTCTAERQWLGKEQTK
jgi:hypothetical protein